MIFELLNRAALRRVYGSYNRNRKAIEKTYTLYIGIWELLNR